jgi:hypothetical protein
VACTSARFGDPESWRARAELVRSRGTTAIGEFAVGRWFTPGFRDRRPDLVEHHKAMLLATPSEGYAACCDAL